MISKEEKHGYYRNVKLFLKRKIFSKEVRVQFVLRMLADNPQKQVDYLLKNSAMYGLGKKFPRTLKIDLDNPTLFNEKLLWLKYNVYNNDPLVAKCYDKYQVREYIANCGCDEILNDLYGVWKKPEEIPWNEMPDNCVIKKTCGSGSHIFIKDGVVDIDEAIKLLKRSGKREKMLHVASGDLFANVPEQRIICEKKLDNTNGYSSISDYKFYCFNGVPHYLFYIWDRKERLNYHKAFKKIDWRNGGKLIDQSNFYLDSENVEIEVPESYEKMLEVCKKLAKPFPFVRVDLYDENGKIIFGELTFTPEGSYVLSNSYNSDGSINYECLETLGDLLII